MPTTTLNYFVQAATRLGYRIVWSPLPGIFIAERGKENLFAKVRHNEVSFKGESPELVRELFN